MTSDVSEFIVTGTVESGKSHPMAQRIYQLHCMIPNLVTFICRKKKVDMRKSIIDQFENEVLPYPVNDPRSPCEPFVGHNPSAYHWKNGGSTYCFGMQEAKSLLGAQFDAGFVCQAEQLSLEEWEFLSHRCARAGNWIRDGERYGQIWGDANPDVKQHWIPKRAKSDQLKIYRVGFKDNILFYRDGEWTPYGQRRVAHLQNTMTGVRYRRLIEGEWCNAEGIVFPEFDEDVHVTNTIPDWVYGCKTWFVGVDYGHDSPFVAGWFAYNNVTDVLFSAKEWRYTNRLIEDHAKAIKHHSAGLNVVRRLTDHDAQMNHQLEAHGIYTENADKSVLLGLDLMRMRLRNRKLLLYRDQLIERDPVLEDRGAPRDGIEEMGLYRHKPLEKHVGDSTKDDLPMPGQSDHWIDLCRYVIAAVDMGKPLEMDLHTGEMDMGAWNAWGL